MNKIFSKANILVFLQFFLLGLHLYLYNWVCSSIAFILIQVFAGIVGVWGIVAMKLSNLSVSPEIKKGSRLVTSGPYRIIRHPMYTSLILFTIPLTIEHVSIQSIAIQLIFISVLIYKLLFEESLLKNHFAEYLNYSKRTYRIIPFIF